MDYSIDKNQSRNSRTFEERPFRSRYGSELREEENESEDFFSESYANRKSPRRNTYKKIEETSFQPDFLEEEHEHYNNDFEPISSSDLEVIEEPTNVYVPRKSKINPEDSDDEDSDDEVKPRVKKVKKAKVKVGYLGLFDWNGLDFKEKFVRLTWILCGFMLLRLIFMDAGVIDFIRMEKKLSLRNLDLKEIELENRELKNEIDLIKNNSAYQKKLVRDHLGAIESNEYLILFPTDLEDQSKSADG